MNAQLSTDCTVIALYGIHPSPESLHSMYDAFVEWFQLLGQPPNRLGVGGEGFSGQMRTFSRINSQLQKKGFDHVESFSLCTLTPDGTIPVCDWSVKSTISIRYSYGLFGARTSLLESFDQSMLPLARKAIKELKPDYGIGYQGDISVGPSFYAVGISQGGGLHFSDDTREEGLNSARWGDIAMKRKLYRDGILRDVYPWNFLTDSQLNRQVEGKPLEKWIQSDPKRGELSPLAGDMSLWRLNEKHIADVRTILKESRLIFNYKDYEGKQDEEQKDPYVAAVSLMNPVPCLKCHRGVDLDSIKIPAGVDNRQYLADVLKQAGWLITFEGGLTMICPDCREASTGD